MLVNHPSVVFMLPGGMNQRREYTRRNGGFGCGVVGYSGVISYRVIIIDPCVTDVIG